MEDSGISLFSDEYDLYPRILQDVQRALKLKARREARLKSANSNPSSNKSEAASGSSQTSPSRPVFQPIPFPLPPIPDIRETESKPSPGRSGSSITTHPVPSSSDEGTTLDWSGVGSEDDRLDRRWTMSISKRKDKEKHPSNSAVETRESMHAAKILQIRTKVSPRALQRASVAGDQLGRRYNLIYNSLSSSGSFNISKVARWFGSQEGVVQASLEQAEPFTWLKDVEKMRKATHRIPWHLSALIMEEYILQLRGTSRPQIHQRIASLNSSPSKSLSSRPQYPSPQGSSYFSLGPPLTRRFSNEGRVSFEHLGDPVRRSIDRESRKSGESGYSSIRSGSSLPHGLSPTSGHFHRIPSGVGSDNGSLSEPSDDGGRRKRPIIPPAPLNRDILSSSTVKANDQTPMPELRSPFSPVHHHRKFQAGEKSEGASSSIDKSSLDIPPTATGRSFGQQQVHVSLPSGNDTRLLVEQQRQKDADEEQANREYENKKQLLDMTIAQNTRVRQLLNHIAAAVREYDQAQSSLSGSLKVPHRGIPRELVDAFSHDPAAVTGATRKYQSWRAVDDIHNRLVRQRETFQEFLSHSPDVDCSVSESVLADPITALMESLKTLDAERQEIAWRATEVSGVLKTVQTVHADVKAAYNGTLSHTSVIYPEISTIVALEESYKDQYQYFWEIAMDALTFLLDTVTPFWRTYGKMIGNDVQHLLIIPLYRNEFTGEPKRYTIDKFPRRSFRHWMGLFVFFLGSVALTFFQARAAMSSVTNFWLLGIPFPYIRRLMLLPFWTSIIIQWWAFVAELCIVLTQLAVVVWWAGWYVNIFS
ncbi:hypothetical protein C8R44DRAFT_634387 [Mycena epipterygia]|nr:hypothetical protein C8R44DRAFT_634387 [Mycena epipterygia]